MIEHPRKETCYAKYHAAGATRRSRATAAAGPLIWAQGRLRAVEQRTPEKGAQAARAALEALRAGRR